MKEYPEVAKTFLPISFLKHDSDVWADITPLQGKVGLRFNAKYLTEGGVKELKKGLLEASVKYGNDALSFHDGMTDVRSIARHEFGHAVDFWARGASNYGFTEAARASGFGVVNETHDRWIGKGFSVVKQSRGLDFVKGAISSYSLTNDKEWFAETFSAVKYGSAAVKRDPIVKNMKVYLDTVIKPAKSGVVFQSDLPHEVRSEVYGRLSATAAKIGLEDML